MQVDGKARFNAGGAWWMDVQVCCTWCRVETQSSGGVGLRTKGPSVLQIGYHDGVWDMGRHERKPIETRIAQTEAEVS